MESIDWQLCFIIGPAGAARDNAVHRMVGQRTSPGPGTVVDDLDAPSSRAAVAARLLAAGEWVVVPTAAPPTWSEVGHLVRRWRTIIVIVGDRGVRQQYWTAPTVDRRHLRSYVERVSRWHPTTARTMDEPLPREVNVAVTDLDRVAVGNSVPGGSGYLVRLCIDMHRAESIVPHGSATFPAERLPPTLDGWWLHAVLTEPGGALTRRPFYLPRVGSSFGCPCPAGRTHRCRPNQRADWLDLPALAPASSGEHVVQLSIHLDAAVVQALTVVVPVALPAPARPTAQVTYSLSVDLADLDRYATRSLSIYSAQPQPDRHRFVVGDRERRYAGFELVEAQAGNAARRLRRLLFDAQFEMRDDRVVSCRYAAEGLSKDADAYLADLRALAVAGREAFVSLVPDPELRRRMRSWLVEEAAARSAPPVIQVAQAPGSRVAIPWQLIYDEPLLADGGDAWVCPSIADFGPAGGGGSAEVPARCPHEAEHDDRRGTLCPFGMWGLAHVIETPPSNWAANLAETTGDEQPADLVLAVNAALTGPAVDRHLASLERLTEPAATVLYDVAALRAGVQLGPDVLYLLCHGRRAGSGTATVELDLGAGGRLSPPDVLTWAELEPPVRWSRRRPLVVLNGCFTGEVLPETLTDFVTAFVTSPGAAGVLVTEIAMAKELACAAMGSFLAEIWAGQGVGAALRRTRWGLLRRGNLMGLAYTPYCDAALRIPMEGRLRP